MNSSKGQIKEIDFSHLPKDLIKLLKIAAEEVGIHKIAIVGGAVRDQLTKDIHSNVHCFSKDLDILIEGSVDTLAKGIQEKLGPARVSIIRQNQKYLTIEMRIDEFPVDIATARKEFYVSPAENPKISTTKIERDLQRRDFTINSMAFNLLEKKLIDPYNGRDAIRTRQLEFIHPKSVEEDPTRIIRGARYAARLNFNISPESIDQIRETLKQWPWSWKQGDIDSKIPPALGTRLHMELDLLFKQEPWEKAIEHLQDWGALVLLDLNLQKDLQWKERIHLAIKLGIEPITAFISNSSKSLDLAKRLQLAQKEQNILAESVETRKFFSEIYQSQKHLNWQASQWCEVIEDNRWTREAIAIAIALKHPLWEPLLQWLEHWQKIESPLSATELIQQGWMPGPQLKKELKRLRYNELDKIYQANTPPGTLIN